jgi:[protein-PII] uridylyltransferase
VSDFYTVIDITANDRLGLLYDLTRTLAEHELEVFVSKATTVLDQVADTFYVKGRDLRKVHDEDRLAALHEDLVAVVSDGAPDG